MIIGKKAYIYFQFYIFKLFEFFRNKYLKIYNYNVKKIQIQNLMID